MPGFGDGIYGQRTVLNQLKLIIKSKRIPNSFLFSGEEGIGKFYTALQFSQLLNSNTKKDISSHIRKLEEPYIKYVFPLPRGRNEGIDDHPTAKLDASVVEEIQNEIEKKSANPYRKIRLEKAAGIKISSIRDIRKFVAFDYSDINYRIILIEDAHLMNNEAQNALLKNLEEPPEGIIFILVTSNTNLLLPTILSRCWQIRFAPLSREDVENILIEHFEIEKQKANAVSYFSDGSVSSALDLLEKDFEKLLDDTITILRYALGRRYNTAYKTFEFYIQENDTEVIVYIFRMILKWLNDIIKDRIDLNNIYFKKYEDTIKKFNSRFREENISESYINIEKYINVLKMNINLNIVVSSIILELASIGMQK